MTDILESVDGYWTETLRANDLPAAAGRRSSRFPPARSCRRACGAAGDDAAFYCPADDTIYVSQAFAAALWDGVLEGLPGTGRAAGDFGVAYVLAHEYAHNLQQEFGVFARPSPTAEPFELQADCFAGAWGNSVYRQGLLEPGDVEEAINTALAVGDFDVSNAQHHGTPEERREAWLLGFEGGDPGACERYLEVARVDRPAAPLDRRAQLVELLGGVGPAVSAHERLGERFGELLAQVGVRGAVGHRQADRVVLGEDLGEVGLRDGDAVVLRELDADVVEHLHGNAAQALRFPVERGARLADRGHERLRVLEPERAGILDGGRVHPPERGGDGVARRRHGRLVGPVEQGPHGSSNSPCAERADQLQVRHPLQLVHELDVGMRRAPGGDDLPAQPARGWSCAFS